MLTVYLPWEASQTYGHLLHDPVKHTQNVGQSPLHELPQPQDDVVCVVPWQKLSWHRVRLPPRVGSRWPRVLENLLEDEVLQSPQTLHFALAPNAANVLRRGGLVLVAACDKPWLQRVLTDLQSTGRRVSRIVPEWGPCHEGEAPSVHWVNPHGQPMAVWRNGDGVWAVNPDSPSWADAITGARVYAEPELSAHAQRWCDTTPVLQTTAWRWSAATESDWNLAQHEWAPDWRVRARRWVAKQWLDLRVAPHWQSVRWGVVAGVLVQWVGLNSWAWQDRQRLAEKQATLVRVSQSMLPGIDPMTDPLPPLRQALAARQQRAAQPQPNDLAVMLASLSEHATDDLSIERLDYQPGELSLHLAASHPPPATRDLPTADPGYQWQVQGHTATLRWTGEP